MKINNFLIVTIALVLIIFFAFKMRLKQESHETEWLGHLAYIEKETQDFVYEDKIRIGKRKDGVLIWKEEIQEPVKVLESEENGKEMAETE